MLPFTFHTNACEKIISTGDFAIIMLSVNKHLSLPHSEQTIITHLRMTLCLDCKSCDWTINPEMW